MAVPDPGRYQFSHVATTARREGNAYILNGGKSVTLHGDSADTLIVSARTAGNVGDESGISLFIVDKNTAGLTVRNYPTFDGHAAAEIGLKNLA